MNGFRHPEEDYDCCPRCGYGYTCPDCKPKDVQVVPMDEVDLSKHGESIISLLLQISTSEDLTPRQKEIMLGTMFRGKP